MKNYQKGFLSSLRTPAVIKRFKKDENGATAVEFAFVVGPFIFLLFSIIESALFFFAGQVLETGVDIVAREVRTGQLQNITEANFKTRMCDATDILFDCPKIKIDMKVVATFDEIKEPPPPPTDLSLDPIPGLGFSSPCAREITQITVYYEWPIITNYVQKYLSTLDSGNALLTAVSLFRTEPFVETGACAAS